MAVLYSFLQTGSLLQSLERYMGMRLRYKTGDTSRLLHCTMTGRGRGIHPGLPLVIPTWVCTLISSLQCSTPPCPCGIHVLHANSIAQTIQQDVSANKTCNWKIVGSVMFHTRQRLDWSIDDPTSSRRVRFTMGVAVLAQIVSSVHWMSTI